MSHLIFQQMLAKKSNPKTSTTKLDLILGMSMFFYLVAEVVK
jgi:hypothetical protein